MARSTRSSSSRWPSRDLQRFIADRLGQADVQITFGRYVADGETQRFVPAQGAPIQIPLEASPEPGQTQERDVAWTAGLRRRRPSFTPYAVRGHAVEPVHVPGDGAGQRHRAAGRGRAVRARAVSVLVSAAMARRFTTPLRRLTEASRGLAEGDLTRRVPEGEVRAGSSEMAELAVQFNAMADRLEESVEIIRRDRDRSRDFLADVSHELRTPLAALRTFNELLREGAGDDPEARDEFLESSAPADRAARLAGPEPARAVQARFRAGPARPASGRPARGRRIGGRADERPRRRRRGVRVTLHHCPKRPIRIRHDPQRIGQVVANLVANAVKFTPRGGSVSVDVAPTPRRRADRGRRHGRRASTRPSCRTSSSGSTAVRGPTRRAAAAAAWGSPSSARSWTCTAGRSRSRAGSGAGSRFVVTLPRDPRLVEGTPAAERAAVRLGRRAGRAGPTTARPSEPAHGPARTCRKLHRPTARR